MQNMTDYCDKIKTSELIARIGALDISATAKYIATVMHTIACVDVGELARITGLERRTIQRAKADYAAASGNDMRDTRDNGVKNDATLATIASNLTFEDDNRVKFDVSEPLAPTHADITTRATKEDLSEVSEVKKESEVIIIEKSVSPKASPRGARLDENWQLPDDWRQWARVTFPATTADQVQTEADTFADYWHGIPGAKGCKLDWSGTWRNWCRRNFARGPMRPGAFNGHSPKNRGTYRPSISEMAQVLEELESEREFAQ